MLLIAISVMWSMHAYTLASGLEVVVCMFCMMLWPIWTSPDGWLHRWKFVNISSNTPYRPINHQTMMPHGFAMPPLPLLHWVNLLAGGSKRGAGMLDMV